jgi:chemotaxis protein MotB
MPKADTEGQAAPPLAPKIIIIKKKKGGHAGHHGGAWKVAYADFVTAMMALFIVLWLLNADPEVKKAVALYFNDPTGSGKLTGTVAVGLGHAIELPKQDMAKVAEKIKQALMSTPSLRQLQSHVEITVTTDGLRIELLETEAGMFFELGRPVPSANGAALLSRLAEELGKLPNKVLLEGHTDSTPFSGTYSNWELSTDRANSARQLMQAHGLHAEQVMQVRGFADRQLRHREDPSAASNRRVSIIVQYLEAPPQTEAEKKAEAQAEAKGEGKGEGKPEAKSEGKPEAKPEIKSEAPQAPKPVSPPKK